MGVSRSYQREHQRRAWDAKAAAAATKKPVCEHRSVSTLPLLGACAAHHCQGPMIQGQLPWENTQCASGCCNVTPASAAADSPRIRTPPSPSQPEWARAPEAAASLTPSCLSEEQMPSGNLHAEAGPNPKLNPGSCANKEEKGKFLPAASGAADYTSTINLMYAASPEYLNTQRIIPKLRRRTLCNFVGIALLLPFVLGFCLYIFFFLGIVFSTCYHWWGFCFAFFFFLVWLFSLFFTMF